MEELYFTHWYHNQTVLHPVGVGVLAALSISIFIVPRRFAILPLLALACVIPSAQRLVLVGFDLTFLRLLVGFGWIRLLIRREFTGFRWTPLDVSVLCWVLVGTVVFCARVATADALVFRLGAAFDALGIYFFCRLMLRRWRDVDRVALSLLMLSLPSAVLFLVESQTGRNLFSMFGGVPELTGLRDGRLRCQGAFPHPILAGCFWASALPLMAARWWMRGASRLFTVLGVASGLGIVAASASSTPVMGVLVALLGACLFPLRAHLRLMRWSFLGVLVGLHIVMQAPVWHLISRVKIFSGSTGWHRYNLIDKFIRNFDEWWLMGTNSTAHWGYHLVDTTNYYVAQGVKGGLATLVLFVAVLALGYRQNGELLRAQKGSPASRAYAWGLGVSLFTHTVMLIAISYFGQVILALYLPLAAIGGLSSRLESRHPDRRFERKPAGSMSPQLRARPSEDHAAREVARRMSGPTTRPA